MKRIPIGGLPFGLLTLLLGFSAGPVLGASYGEAREVHYDQTEKSVDKKLDLLSKKLDLTPEQVFKVKAALDDQLTKLDLLKKEIQEARKKIADETDGSLKAILNPQQQEKYGRIKDEILGKPQPPSGTPDTRASRAR